jgi:hypothetical protein
MTQTAAVGSTVRSGKPSFAGKDKNRPPLEWKEVARFEDAGLVVVVTSSGGFRPRYSAQVGKLRDDKSVAPHIPVRVDGGVDIEVFPLATILAGLLDRAQEYIVTEANFSASEDLDRRIAKETRQAGFGKPQTRVTGKTAKKKEKLKRPT